MHRAVLLASGDFIEPEVLHISGLRNEKLNPRTENDTGGDLKEGTVDNEANFNPNILVGRSLSDVEQDLIIGTVSHCLGNRTQAAHILGISIRTLRNKLRLYTEGGAAVPSPNQIHGDNATLNREAS
jgi:DNA-binding NtrC family response regulator